MKYMLLMHYAVPEDVAAEHGEMSTWPPEDIRAHIAFMGTVNGELTESGELVDAQGLAGPGEARIVRAQGTAPPAVTDGPFPETKELLAGFWIVDCDSPERAVEIASRVSAAPGRGGAPLNIPIEVRQVMSEPPEV